MFEQEQEIIAGFNKAVQSLATDTDIAPWKDLVRHFAFGRLYVVRDGLSLKEAADIIKNDKASELKFHLEAGRFGSPSPEEAQEWHLANQEFDVLILSPFVIVSPRISGAR